MYTVSSGGYSEAANILIILIPVIRDQRLSKILVIIMSKVSLKWKSRQKLAKPCSDKITPLPSESSLGELGYGS